MTGRDPFASACPATPEQVLACREARAQKQKSLLRAHGGVLVSFTLNLPGAYKCYPLAKRAFDEGARAIARELERHRIPVTHKEQAEAVTGCEGFTCVDAGATAVKRVVTDIEEFHPLGRLFDIDVLNEQGERSGGGSPERGQRGCIVCGGPVWECVRARAHPPEELALRAARMIDDYFARRFADDVCRTAVRALLYEVSVTPKPGLVDRAGNGAHRDMSFLTFLDSGCALIPYFRDITLAAIGAEDAGGLLSGYRAIGRWAEDAMLAATNGVNTHKGLLFSLGVVCVALGRLYSGGKTVTADTVFAACAQTAGGIERELETGGSPGESFAAAPESASGGKTYGEAAFARHRLTGARGEAAAGFPHVRGVGLPVLREYRARGCSVNDAGAIALLHLIARVDDTNIAGRAGFAVLRRAQEEAARLLRENGEDPAALLKAAKELDRRFVAQNISPGGCADLLAVTLMVHWATE